MAKTQYTKAALKEAIAGKLQRHFACEVKDAKKDQIYEACALVIRDALTEHMIETQNEVERDGDRQVHYLCMEFLVGRSLRNNAYNLGMLDALTAALADMGFEMADIFEQEADPGLGNGGLGRLAACYMDGMATTGVRGTGYSIRYEHGIFKQKIEDGKQVELPDSWLASGDVWQIPAMDETREVKIGGTGDAVLDALIEAGAVSAERTENGLCLSCPFSPHEPFALAPAFVLCRAEQGRAVLDWKAEGAAEPAAPSEMD